MSRTLFRRDPVIRYPWLTIESVNSWLARFWRERLYSRSPQIPELQQFQKGSKPASAGS